jgi:type II secretory pathway component PulF
VRLPFGGGGLCGRPSGHATATDRGGRDNRNRVGEDVRCLTKDPAIAGQRPLSTEDSLLLCEELCALIRAGLPLEIGLRGTAARFDGAARELATRLSQRLAGGETLDAALSAEQGVLAPEFVALFRAGLRAGGTGAPAADRETDASRRPGPTDGLTHLLTSVLQLGENVIAVQQRLRTALIYPAVVLVVAGLMFAGYCWLVIPRLVQMQEFLEGPPPWLWQQLMAVHEWLVGGGGWKVLIAGGSVVAGALAGWMVWRPGSRRGLGVRWLPGVRDLRLAQFARVLSVLLEQELPFPEACRLSGATTGDGRLVEAADELASRVAAGQSLGESVNRLRVLPPFLRWLMAVGEREQGLANSLRQAAAVYEQRGLIRLELFRRFVPPAIVLVLGGFLTLTYGLLLFIPVTQLLERLGGGAR